MMAMVMLGGSQWEPGRLSVSITPEPRPLAGVGNENRQPPGGSYTPLPFYTSYSLLHPHFFTFIFVPEHVCYFLKCAHLIIIIHIFERFFLVLRCFTLPKPLKKPSCMYFKLLNRCI